MLDTCSVVECMTQIILQTYSVPTRHAATETGSAPDADHAPCAVDLGKEDAANNFALGHCTICNSMVDFVLYIIRKIGRP